MTRGRFITLEGSDGAGKSTQRDALVELLARRGIDFVATREPGGTALGERLRELLLAPAEKADPETETLLVFAARREHLARVIEPALAAGRWVVCDRFTDATFAYQGGGSGVEWGRVEMLERWVQGTLQPDLTLLFDLDPALGLARAGRIKTPDRFEREAMDFHRRVRDAYLRRAAEHPGRIRRIDAGRSISEVQKAVEEAIAGL